MRLLDQRTSTRPAISFGLVLVDGTSHGNSHTTPSDMHEYQYWFKGGLVLCGGVCIVLALSTSVYLAPECLYCPWMSVLSLDVV